MSNTTNITDLMKEADDELNGKKHKNKDIPSNEQKGRSLASYAFSAQSSVQEYKDALERNIMRLSEKDVHDFYRDIFETEEIVKEIKKMLTARL